MSTHVLGPDGTPIYPQIDPLEPPIPGLNPPENRQNVLGTEVQVVASAADGPHHLVEQARVVIRCTPAYRDWVHGLADRLGLNVTQCVTQGLLRLGESSGYQWSMPTRYVPKKPGRRQHPVPTDPTD